MTTKVTVDAHAGWPVEVNLRKGEPGNPDIFEAVIVDPMTTKDFYIHSGCSIKEVKELPR